MKSLVRFKNTYLILVTGGLIFLFACASFGIPENNGAADGYSKGLDILTQSDSLPPQPAAERMELYLPMLRGKSTALVANPTSLVAAEGSFSAPGGRYTHLVDTLLSSGVDLKLVFAPEHGFRGEEDAGATIRDTVDERTGLPLISLHGKHKKPTPDHLKGIDVVVFDIQDVGVRFYTYISTLSYVMEACAEQGIPLVVLDRPNPNGHYVDGPMLEPRFRSFLGLHPIPLVYGMTIGEYAQMVNGERWLENGVQCDLQVIPLAHYDHSKKYELPVRPSPNLPNSVAISLYPSLGLFEGTVINAGRGTEQQFQRYGAPFFPPDDFQYTPKPNFGSTHPKFEGQLCNGVDLSNIEPMSKVDPGFLLDAYSKTPKDQKFFGATFTAHAGTEALRKQVESRKTAEEIRDSWKKDIGSFLKIRARYLLYD